MEKLQNGDFVWTYSTEDKTNIDYGVVVNDNIVFQLVGSCLTQFIDDFEDIKIGGIGRGFHNFGEFKYYLLDCELIDDKYIPVENTIYDYRNMVNSIRIPHEEAIWALECLYNSENLSVSLN